MAYRNWFFLYYWNVLLLKPKIQNKGPNRLFFQGPNCPFPGSELSNLGSELSFLGPNCPGSESSRVRIVLYSTETFVHVGVTTIELSRRTIAVISLGLFFNWVQNFFSQFCLKMIKICQNFMIFLIFNWVQMSFHWVEVYFQNFNWVLPPVK